MPPPWPDPRPPARPQVQAIPDPCLAPWHSAEAARPERRTAILLALCFGFVGAHRFYLHQPWLGLCYLVFSWTLIPLIVSFFDAAALRRLSCTEFHELYGLRVIP